MIARSSYLSLLLTLVLLSTGVSSAQRTADNSSSIYPDSKDSDKTDQPKSVRELLDKARIQKEKKDFETMLSRGDEALKISEELEESLENTSQFTDKDLTKLESLEKIVKKIRGELGGNDEDDVGFSNETFIAQPNVIRPGSVAEGFKALKNTTLMLVDELKKTSRFTISAAAIQSTNTVLRLARFLRFKK